MKANYNEVIGILKMNLLLPNRSYTFKTIMSSLSDFFDEHAACKTHIATLNKAIEELEDKIRKQSTFKKYYPNDSDAIIAEFNGSISPSESQSSASFKGKSNVAPLISEDLVLQSEESNASSGILFSRKKSFISSKSPEGKLFSTFFSLDYLISYEK